MHRRLSHSSTMLGWIQLHLRTRFLEVSYNRNVVSRLWVLNGNFSDYYGCTYQASIFFDNLIQRFSNFFIWSTLYNVLLWRSSSTYGKSEPKHNSILFLVNLWYGWSNLIYGQTEFEKFCLSKIHSTIVILANFFTLKLFIVKYLRRTARLP